MTIETSNVVRRFLAPTMAAAALTLAGCAATHVGEDWQCPLAQGARCASVAAADPAVRGADPMAPPAGGGLLTGEGHRRGDATPPAAPAENRPILPDPEPGRAIATGDSTDGGKRDCPAFCRPFRWFVRLLAADNGGKATPTRPPASDAPEPAASDSAINETAAMDETSRAAVELISDDSVRLPETVGRVWIAPYVDANGVYREASWVRIVIVPAAWRHP